MNSGSSRAGQGTVWASTVDPADRAALDPGVPADLDRHPDVLVVGGGAIGLATAVYCRGAGIGRVLVIEAAGWPGPPRAAPAGRSPRSCTSSANRRPSSPWPGPAWRCTASSTRTGSKRWAGADSWAAATARGAASLAATLARGSAARPRPSGPVGPGAGLDAGQALATWITTSRQPQEVATFGLSRFDRYDGLMS